MQPNQGNGMNPSSINPFAQPPPAINPFNSYDVQTTYVPHAEGTVPAVGGPANPFSAPPVGQVPAVTAPAQPSGFRLPFTNSTTVPAVSGSIGKPDGRGQGPAPPPTGSRPDDGQFGATQQPQQAPLPASSDTRPLLRQEQPQENYSNYAFYNIRRYRPYFDVDTKEVLWRVGSSFIGAFRPNFMQVTQERPDMYGPFWVATTLIFVTAVAGNYASYIEFKRSSSPSPPVNGTAAAPAPSPSSESDIVSQQWFTDYTKLGSSAGIFYGYVFVISTLLWLALRYFRADMKLVNALCVYGYALTIFIPISLVCIIPNDLMRWLVVGGGTLTSGLFLLMNLRERIMAAGPGKSVPMLLLVLAIHVGLGVVLKIFFFSY